MKHRKNRKMVLICAVIYLFIFPCRTYQV